MTNDALQLKIKERLNRLDSRDYDDLEPWQLLEAFNKAQLQWARAQIAGLGPRGTLDEGSKQATDDLQVLLFSQPLALSSTPRYEEAPLPADYLGFKRISADAQNACCPARPLRIEPCKQGNVDLWLRDTHHRPDFEWAETFYTLAANYVQVYTNGEFTLSNPVLTYYRHPRPLTITGVLDLATSELATADVSCEFAAAVCELLLDACVSILAGDTENTTQYQRAQQQAAAHS